ncbi:hypothetical protein SDC9_189826 [bioreactor metagenome]|uniref:Uncharacterized protein n=1 Tax=bioreactor metagenome TaxID=1076179 RepID=A0A645HVP8_9ZZZZ
MTDTYFSGTASGFDEGEFTIINGAASSHYQSTQVIAKTEPSYIIVIPAAVDFGTLQKDTGIKSRAFQVRAENVVIEPGSRIDVDVSNIDPMDNGYGNELEYMLYTQAGSQVPEGSNYASFDQDGMETGSVKVDTSLIPAAGNYSGTMDFSISYR